MGAAVSSLPPPPGHPPAPQAQGMMRSWLRETLCPYLVSDRWGQDARLAPLPAWLRGSARGGRGGSGKAGPVGVCNCKGWSWPSLRVLLTPLALRGGPDSGNKSRRPGP